ncbi:hypothetical protein V5799_032937 [Amblyomma americanum]|uniref:Secreted protein n=1 Tax=Amblyomma americanum TaxID=6943 RepID=A0AAQ4DPR4_AMBAM
MLNFVLCFVQVFLGLLGNTGGNPSPIDGYACRVTSAIPLQHLPDCSTDALHLARLPHVENCAVTCTLERPFGTTATPVTSSEPYKIPVHPSVPSSGLGSIARSTMLDFVLCFVQVLLGLLGNTGDNPSPIDGYACRVTSAIPLQRLPDCSTDALHLARLPHVENCAVTCTLERHFGTTATPVSSSEPYKIPVHPSAPSSGLGSIAQSTMLNFVLCFVQVLLGLLGNTGGNPSPIDGYACRVTSAIPLQHLPDCSTDALHLARLPHVENCAVTCTLERPFGTTATPVLSPIKPRSIPRRLPVGLAASPGARC